MDDFIYHTLQRLEGIAKLNLFNLTPAMLVKLTDFSGILDLIDMGVCEIEGVGGRLVMHVSVDREVAQLIESELLDLAMWRQSGHPDARAESIVESVQFVFVSDTIH